jgi:hypothetical protein
MRDAGRGFLLSPLFQSSMHTSQARFGSGRSLRKALLTGEHREDAGAVRDGLTEHRRPLC